MSEPFRLTRDEAVQPMVEILSSGSSRDVGKSARSLMVYIKSIAINQIESVVRRDDRLQAYSTKTINPKNNEDSVIAAANLRIRDLRQLYNPVNPNEAYKISVRNKCVVISLDPFRAVVMADRLIVLLPANHEDHDNMSHILEIFVNTFKGWHRDNLNSKQTVNDSGRSNVFTVGESEEGADIDHIPDSHTCDMHSSVPFETQVYEAIFTTVGALHRHEFSLLESEVKDLHSNLFPLTSQNIPYVLQAKLYSLKDHLRHMTRKVEAFHAALSSIAADDNAMALMNLSSNSHVESDHGSRTYLDTYASNDRTVDLLHSHILDIQSLQAKLSFLFVTLKNAESSILLKLTVAQDVFMIADTRLLVAGLLIAFASYITGALGMNFDYVVHFYIIKGSFSTVFAVTLVIIIIGTPAHIFYLEESGALPRMLEQRPNKDKNKNRIENENKTLNDVMFKNRIVKNNCPPSRDFKGADVMGISSMI